MAPAQGSTGNGPIGLSESGCRFLLRFAFRMGDIAHVHDDVGLQNLFEGRAKRGNQFMREVGDEAHGVG